MAVMADRKGKAMIFRHFKTLKQVRKYISERPGQGLVYRKVKGRRAKPYMVGTELDFLHFA